MKSVFSQKPCDTCCVYSQVGNPYNWERECDRCIKLGQWKNEVLIRLSKIEDILGDEYDLDRLKELVQADREGRCMVAKLKIGEHVFVVGKKKIVKARIQEIYFDDMSELIYLVDFECDNSCDGCPFNSWSQSWEGEWECDGEYGDGSVKQSDFGKTVFLTREEAEAALEKMKEDK